MSPSRVECVSDWLAILRVCLIMHVCRDRTCLSPIQETDPDELFDLLRLLRAAINNRNKSKNLGVRIHLT